MNQEDEEKLAHLLLVWEEAKKKDIHLQIDDLCSRHPHLKRELKRRTQLLIDTDWMELPGKSRPVISPDAVAGDGTGRQPSNRYQTGSLVGESRFSKVWCGFDVELHRVIAIKVLKKEQTEASGAFLAAARQHAAIKHSRIVQIHDIVASSKSTFVVLDYMERGSLRKCLSINGVGVKQSILWTIQLAEALEYLHRNGITHQNVKPENILIDKRGQALLSDAGLGQEANSQSNIYSAFTQSLYTSPEQSQGGPVGPASDIYSLAVVLHEMATGQLPFGSDNGNNQKPAKHLPRIKIADNLPRNLTILLKSSLATNPADRPATITAFSESLKSILPAEPSRRFMLPLLAGSAMATAGFYIWIRNKPGLSSAWFRELFSSPPQQQVELIKQSLVDRNPGFNGTVRGSTTNGVLTGLDFCTDSIDDISPLSELAGLKFLKMTGSVFRLERAMGALADLAPLRHISLEHLEVSNNELIKSIAPLKGLPLDHLNIARTSVEDISPMAGSTLKTLNVGMTPIVSLAPLAETAVNNLFFNNTNISDISFMRGMRMEVIRCHYTNVQNLGPIEGHPLKALDCNETPVQSIEPLAGTKTLQTLNITVTKVTNLKPLLTLSNLKFLWCDVECERDGWIIQKLTQLERLNGFTYAIALREQYKKP